MLRAFHDIKNFRLAAEDGDIGKVKEFYFDDRSWIVRYVVVDTGGWLPGRKVLLLPRSLGTISEESRHIAVHLTKEQIEHSPSIETDKPVSRQFEEKWYRYYKHPAYWVGAEAVSFGTGPAAVAMQEQDVEEARKVESVQERGDPHLRSTSEIIGYSIHASDGKIGHVDDFIVDDEAWRMRYIVILRSWWPGKKVILSSEWIERMSFEAKEVFVALSRETIENAPEWNHAEPISREFEQRLFDYYGRPGYWPVN
ncbi:MAG TPA: PRC-barrel domain-containing protein [Terrimicrobiaceae bacterium]